MYILILVSVTWAHYINPSTYKHSNEKIGPSQELYLGPLGYARQCSTKVLSKLFSFSRLVPISTYDYIMMKYTLWPVLSSQLLLLRVIGEVRADAPHNLRGENNIRRDLTSEQSGHGRYRPMSSHNLHSYDI